MSLGNTGGNQSPSLGRFQARHVHEFATQDLKAATGDKFYFPVKHDFIEILGWGWEIMTAPGAVTTSGAARLDKIPKNNGTRVNGVNANATLTFAGTQSIYSSQETDLNLSYTASPNPVQSEPSRPTAVKGDVLIINLITQGVGAGAQDVRPWIMYRERTRA